MEEEIDYVRKIQEVETIEGNIFITVSKKQDVEGLQNMMIKGLKDEEHKRKITTKGRRSFIFIVYHYISRCRSSYRLREC